MGEGESKNPKRAYRRCIIVGAGDFFGFPPALQAGMREEGREDTKEEGRLRDSAREGGIGEVPKGDLLIAADAGYLHLKKAGIAPSLIVGDFDSMAVEGVDGQTGPAAGLSIFADADKAEYLQHLGKTHIDGIEARIINPVKNDPDMMACARIGIQAGCREFHLLGASGGRIDHSLANVQILHFLALRGYRNFLYTETQVLTAIHNGSACFGAERQGYFTALSLSDVSRGVTERGFKYVVEDVTLHSHTPTGLSNEFVGTPAQISVREGTLLLIYDFRHSQGSCV